MNRLRIQIPTGPGVKTTMYLEPLAPLDGHGGKLRQRFAVMNRHYENIGTLTRYRNDNGTVVNWTVTSPGFRTSDHHSRAAALHHLIDTTKG